MEKFTLRYVETLGKVDAFNLNKNGKFVCAVFRVSKREWLVRGKTFKTRREAVEHGKGGAA